MITEVSLLASQLANPREGHLDIVFHMFAYLKNKHNSWMVFDPTYLEINMSVFKKCDQKHFYGDIKEAVTLNASKPCGKEVDLCMFLLIQIMQETI